MRKNWHELHVQIRPVTLAELRAAAEAADVSVSAWMRAAIGEKLERERAASQPA